jgi:hypothetical protein
VEKMLNLPLAEGTRLSAAALHNGLMTDDDRLMISAQSSPARTQAHNSSFDRMHCNRVISPTWHCITMTQ